MGEYISDITLDHLGAGATVEDLAAFCAAALAYQEARGGTEQQAIDAIWDNGDFWPNVERWAPDEAALADAQPPR